MKKTIIIAIQFLFVFYSVFAGMKIKKTSSVILDWQYKDEGTSIPSWVTAIAQTDKKNVIKELELEGYKVWTVFISGENLEMLEMFDDVQGVVEEISNEMTTEINEIAISNNEINKIEMIKVQEQISQSNIRGLQKVSSFWIKNGTLKKGIKKAKKESDYNIKFNYYSVWIMDSDLYEIQLKKIMDNIKD